jgi:threonine/homoserine/homoserine lactone efflux protein
MSLPHSVVFRLCLFCQIVRYMTDHRFIQASILMLPSVILSMFFVLIALCCTGSKIKKIMTGWTCSIAW